MRIKSKAIVGALGATAVAGAVVMTGASSAYFFDAENVDGHKIQAGTLDLDYKIDGDAVKNGKIYLENLKPGDSADVTASISNVGTVDGVFSAKATNVKNLENGLWEPEKEVNDTDVSGDLDRYLEVWMGKQYFGTIADLPKALGNVPLKAGETHAATFTIKVADKGTARSGNEIMSDVYTFNLDMELAQARR